MKIVGRKELSAAVNSFPLSPLVAILLGGDRLSCCDEGAVVEADGRVVAVATVAPVGEESSGQPTIVAVYTLPAYRGRGYGRVVFEAALRRCLDRGYARVRVDVMSAGMVRIIQSLPAEMRDVLDVHDMGTICDMMPG